MLGGCGKHYARPVLRACNLWHCDGAIPISCQRFFLKKSYLTLNRSYLTLNRSHFTLNRSYLDLELSEIIKVFALENVLKRFKINKLWKTCFCCCCFFVWDLKNHPPPPMRGGNRYGPCGRDTTNLKVITLVLLIKCTWGQFWGIENAPVVEIQQTWR